MIINQGITKTKDEQFKPSSFYLWNNLDTKRENYSVTQRELSYKFVNKCESHQVKDFFFPTLFF